MNGVPREIKGTGLIHSDEEYLVVTRKICIFALYNVNKHSMPRQKREKSGTGICHVMQGKESKTCPYDSVTNGKGETRSDFYRGMQIAGHDGKNVFVSARDVGNIAAGYMCKKN